MKYLRELKFENIEQILWIKIETAPIEETLTEESIYWDAWEQKVKWDDRITNVDEIKARWVEKASIYKEFSKITSISYGRVSKGVLKVKELAYSDEAKMISEFFSDVNMFVGGGVKFLGGFSLMQFDVPFLAFRAMVNDVEVISSFDIGGIAQWNIKHVIDVQNLLRGTSSTSLSLEGASVSLGLGSVVNKVLSACNLFCKYTVNPLVDFERVAGVVKVEKLPILEKLYNSKQFNDEVKEYLREKKILKKDIPTVKEQVLAVYKEEIPLIGSNKKELEDINKQRTEEVEQFFKTYK